MKKQNYKKACCHSSIDGSVSRRRQGYGGHAGGKNSATSAPGAKWPLAAGGGDGAFCILHSAFPRGFTLIELVVTIVIIGIMAAITIQYLATGAQVYALLLAQQQAEGDAISVVKRMRREVRVVQSNITARRRRWKFCTRQGTTNEFRHKNNNTVVLNGKLLAVNVNTFRLTYYDTTNGVLTPLPLSTANRALIRRVALELKVTNAWAASEMNVNFFLQDGYLK